MNSFGANFFRLGLAFRAVWTVRSLALHDARGGPLDEEDYRKFIAAYTAIDALDEAGFRGFLKVLDVCTPLDAIAFGDIRAAMGPEAMDARLAFHERFASSSASQQTARPEMPREGQRLLELLVPADWKEAVVSDFIELYERDKTVFWRQILRSAPYLLCMKLLDTLQKYWTSK